MPVVISQNLYLSASNNIVQPLNYARIGYQSYLDDGMLTLTAGVEQAGFPLDNVLNSQTFERFKTTGVAAIIEIDLGTTQDVDYIAMVGRDIRISDIYYDNGSGYTLVSSLNDSTKKARMQLFDKVSARYWQIVLGAIDDNLDVANIKLGEALQMYRPIYGGHSPVTLNRITAKTPTRSEGGEFLSSSITRQGFAGSYDYRHLPANWYRTTFDPFVEHARTGTYYIAWNPLQFPLEIAYGWTEEDFSPSNMGIRDLMQVSWNIRGYDAS